MTCAFALCAEADCVLEGGCVTIRFAHVPRYERASDLRDDASMLAGTKQRQVRDPKFIKRKRKAIIK